MNNKLFASPKSHANYLNKRVAKHPTSGDFRDGSEAEGHWYEVQGDKVIMVEQVAGSSGVYLIEIDYETGETLRDGRPWQMTVG